MLVYRFPFRPEAAGQAIQIHRSDGTVVDSGVVPSEVDVTGVVAYEAELPEGNYYVTGATPGWDGVSGPVGVLDVPSSIEAGGGGGGAAETVDLVASGSGDADGNDFPLTVVLREGTTMPSWGDLTDDTFTFTDDGVYAVSTKAIPIIANFPTTTPSAPDGEVSLYIEGHREGIGAWNGSDYFATGASPADLDVEGEMNFVSPTVVRAGETLVHIGNGSALEGDGVTPITDGTLDITAYVQITRLISPVTLP